MNDVAATRPAFEQRRLQRLLSAATVSVKAAIRCPLCPGITEDTHSLDKLDKRTVQSRIVWTSESEALVADDAWRTTVLTWISDYHEQHGHGPTWLEFRDTHDPQAAGLKFSHRNRLLASLYRHGYVTGRLIPFGLDVRDEEDRQEWLADRAKMQAKRAAKKAAARTLCGAPSPAS